MVADRGSKRWVIVAVLALGWLAGVLWRLWLGHPITHPVAHTDEDSSTRDFDGTKVRLPDAGESRTEHWAVWRR